MNFEYLGLLIFTILQCEIYAIDVSVDEDSELSISCENTEGISVNSASWTYNLKEWHNYFTPNWRNMFFMVGKPFGLCTYDETEAVKLVCQGKNLCEFTADRNLLSNSCNYWMVLNVNYDCLPCNSALERSRRSVKDIESFKCDPTLRLPDVEEARNHMICPNLRFQMKHLCQTCTNTVDEARRYAIRTEFVRSNSRTTSTSLNSVFIASNMYYSQRDYHCTFAFKASKYECRRTARWEWFCSYVGEKFATHNLITGHYMPELDSN